MPLRRPMLARWPVRSLLPKIAFLERVLHPAPESGPVTLTRQRLYILPTQHGLLFALMLLVMLLGSINYGNSMGFVLTFLLGSLAVVSILHTYRNLARLTIHPCRSAPVFAGQHAVFSVCIANPDNFPRYAISLRTKTGGSPHADLAAGQTTCLEFSLPATRRGLLEAGRFTLFSTFPLGLFRVWTHLDLDMRCLVYPHPAPDTLPLPAAETEGGSTGLMHGEEQDDFSGLRTYRSGDSPRHVAWKAVARGQGVYTKQFDSETQQETWLDWDTLSGMETEARLSRLSRWVLDADAAGQHYGLRLPGQAFDPATGPGHRNRCLEALALFGT